ncbi:MAG: hypothetical protein V1895_03295 [Parcubacteria group bacterium]
MVLTVEQLKGATVSDSPLRVKRVLVDYHKIAVVALVASRASLLGRTVIIPLEQIAEIKESGIKLAGSALEQNSKTKELYSDEQKYGDLSERAVYTERKRYLGKLVTYKLDSTTGLITVLWVKPPLALSGLWRQILLISRSQVIKIEPAAIIVDEAIIKAALKPATAAELASRESEAALGTASSISLDHTPNA